MTDPLSRDVTHLVSFSDNDGENLPLARCVCGKEFKAWDFILSIYPDTAKECPGCGRRLYFRYELSVYEIVEDLEGTTETVQGIEEQPEIISLERWKDMTAKLQAANLRKKTSRIGKSRGLGDFHDAELPITMYEGIKETP